nr:MAG TPA: hypothetical protein [Caudoviricetes sp.]
MVIFTVGEIRWSPYHRLSWVRKPVGGVAPPPPESRPTPHSRFSLPALGKSG